jgi:predicted phage terminase large subunit-like protein
MRQNLSSYSQKVFNTLEPGTPYLHNWHVDHLCWQLGRVASGEVRRLIINVPPRSMKSILVSVGFTSWILGRDPTKRVICVSYSEDLARKLSIDTRIVMESRWYQRLFPDFQLASKKPRTMELATTVHGYRFAAGMGGAVLGRGADLIVVDDPIKPVDALSQAERRRVNEAFDNTIYTRLNDKRHGSIVIIMQRLHQDDLVGHVLERGEWEVVTLPAIATEMGVFQLGGDSRHRYVRRPGEVLHEEREPHEVLEATRRSQGSLTFSAQYQQSPVPVEGNIVKREWLRYYTDRPESYDLIVASWDTASTLSENADYSVGTVWGAKGLDFYLIDLVRGRFEIPDLRRAILDLSRKWSANQTIIEETDVGRAILQDLRREGELRPILIRPRFDKEARFLAQSARFEAGQVHVPTGASWLAEWLNELLAFPNGQHDDQVDSTSQALNYLTSRARSPGRAATIQRPAAVNRPAGFGRPRPK